MANLKKPTICECNSTEFKHEFRPEKWVCKACDKVGAERPQRITGVCLDCGAKRGEKLFVKKKNLCKDCLAARQLVYREENADKLLAYRTEYFKNLDKKERWQRVRRSIQRKPESFLRDQLTHIKSHSLRPRKQDTKDPIKREYNLDIDYVMQLWTAQNGICALTHIKMTHEFNNMRSVSIDRIDSSKGHIRGNIQLICMSINRMKNNHTQAETMQFVREIRERNND